MQPKNHKSYWKTLFLVYDIYKVIIVVMIIWLAKMKITFCHKISYLFNLSTSFCHNNAKEKSREVGMKKIAEFSNMLVAKHIDSIKV